MSHIEMWTHRLSAYKGRIQNLRVLALEALTQGVTQKHSVTPYFVVGATQFLVEASTHVKP